MKLVRAEISPNSDIRYIYFLSAIAVILLVVASINFTSLATAQALRRYKEAGIRKVLLQQFAFKITISFWVFLIAIAGILCIAIVTVSYESFKAATTNPVNILKTE